MNRDIIGKIFPDMLEEINKGNCPTCGEEVGLFKDNLSEREFAISGMCQRCQDKVFTE
jgi:endogenous inhibitor of DNA gyrase (YacG/DUF329 family)